MIYRTAESLYCTPKTNIILYVNYTAVNNNNKKTEIQRGAGRLGEIPE